ncbi:MAG TPA: cell envelope integrity protein TolA [Thermoanaerobaculia bacterium]
MRDPVADVLAQRAAMDRGTGGSLAISLLLHAGLAGMAAYAAFHSPAPQGVRMVNIQFANAPATPAPRAAAPAAPKPAAPAPPQPAIAEPVPKIAEPKPVAPAKTVAAPEKNTVPLSPFGQSAKKGSETPAAETPKAVPAPPSVGGVGTTTTDVPIGGSGVTGLEGGDFPYTLYIDGMQRRIGNNWFRPQVSSGTTAVIYFRIQRDGTITDPRIQTSSGNSAFDRAAISAVRSSTPLNPLPFAYNGTYLGVHLTFR